MYVITHRFYSNSYKGRYEHVIYMTLGVKIKTIAILVKSAGEQTALVLCVNIYFHADKIHHIKSVMSLKSMQRKWVNVLHSLCYIWMVLIPCSE